MATSIIITFFGSILIALNSQGGSFNLYGNMLAILGALAIAVYMLIGNRVRKKLTTYVYTYITYTVSFITLLILSLISNLNLIGYDFKNIVIGILLAVVCTLLGHSVFNYALKYESAAFVSLASLGEPVFAMILAALLFSQYPVMLEYVGGIFVFVGLYLNVKGS